MPLAPSASPSPSPAATSTTTASANLALPPLPPYRTMAMTSLLALPLVRAAVPRPGRNPHTQRPTNLQALLGQMAGQVAVPGCGYCNQGAGQWTLCVSVPGHFGGSCANCHYDCKGTRCSLRPAAAPTTPATPATPATPTTPSTPATSATSSRRGRRTRPLPQVTPVGFNNVRAAPGTLPPVIVPLRRAPARRARRLAALHREIASLYEEEAEELQEEEEEGGVRERKESIEL